MRVECVLAAISLHKLTKSRGCASSSLSAARTWDVFGLKIFAIFSPSSHLDNTNSEIFIGQLIMKSAALPCIEIKFFLFDKIAG